jgi:oxygen-independent coproporphyrinogen-3 oxidase
MIVELTNAVSTSRDATFGVYIHWPFCAQKCPYCDFNSHVRFNGWDEERFLAAYLRELDWVAGEIAAGKESARTVSSIFFGGGTPSLMKPGTVGAILDHIAKLWPIDANAEITLEANPGSVEAERFKGYRAAGVSRVSMGLQSLRDEELKKLGRIHTVAEAKAALAIARNTFERFSFDLIYARPRQTADDWRAELAEALDMAGDHISLYQLTIEPDTPYAALHAAGKLIVPDEDAAATLYEITAEMTEAKGFVAYEISNYARPGAESRHNLLYWRYGEYAGVGPGAHGRLLVNDARDSSPLVGRSDVRIATVAERHPESWAARVEATGHGYTELTALSEPEQADEMLLMGLRLSEGVDLDSLARLGGLTPAPAVLSELQALGLIEVMPAPAGSLGAAAGFQPADWRSDELAEIRMCLGPGTPPEPLYSQSSRGIASRTHRIRATPRGRFVLNAVVAKLSQSFEAVAAEPGMDISLRDH